MNAYKVLGRVLRRPAHRYLLVLTHLCMEPKRDNPYRFPVVVLYSFPVTYHIN